MLYFSKLVGWSIVLYVWKENKSCHQFPFLQVYVLQEAWKKMHLQWSNCVIKPSLSPQAVAIHGPLLYCRGYLKDLLPSGG